MRLVQTAEVNSYDIWTNLEEVLALALLPMYKNRLTKQHAPISSIGTCVGLIDSMR